MPFSLSPQLWFLPILLPPPPPTPIPLVCFPCKPPAPRGCARKPAACGAFRACWDRLPAARWQMAALCSCALRRQAEKCPQAQVWYLTFSEETPSRSPAGTWHEVPAFGSHRGHFGRWMGRSGSWTTRRSEEDAFWIFSGQTLAAGGPEDLFCFSQAPQWPGPPNTRQDTARIFRPQHPHCSHHPSFLES